MLKLSSAYAHCTYTLFLLCSLQFVETSASRYFLSNPSVLGAMKIFLPKENAEYNTSAPPGYYDYTNYAITLGNIDDYRISRRIGKGKYSEVFGGRAGKERVVIKALKPVRGTKIKREILVLNNLNHPNIITLRDVVYDKDTDTHSLIFNYASHKDFADVAASMHFGHIRLYTRQVLEALDHAHSRGIMHRDIKPQNLIINVNSKHLHIIDWGLAEFFHPGQEYSVRVSSRYYKAPELLVNYPFYDYSIDMWSFGCVLAELIFKRSPFFGSKKSTLPQIHELIKVLGTEDLQRYVSKYEIPFEVPKDQQVQRVPLASLLPEGQQAVYKDAIDLLEKLLVYDHSERPTARECLNHLFYSKDD